MKTEIFTSSLGNIKINHRKNRLYLLEFCSEPASCEISNYAKQVQQQIVEYTNRERKSFDINIDFTASPFATKVYMELLKIPYGTTASYKQIAVNLGNPNACRAVGMANNKNPIAIIIPCHRVIGSNNKLVGYAGGLDIKQMLLNIEGIQLV